MMDGKLKSRGSRQSVIYFGLSALLLVAVACTCGQLSSIPGLPGGSGGAATPTLIALNGGSGSSGGSTSGGNGGSGSFTFVDPDKASLKSSHSKFTMKYTGTKDDGTPVDGTFTLEQLHTSDPLASSIQWTGEGEAIASNNAGTFKMVQIGDATYMITSGKDANATPECLAMSSAGAGADLANQPGYSPDTFFTGGDMSGAHRILPDETVNGVLAQHWQFTKADVSLLTANYTDYTVDAWTAVDGGYAVKSTFVGDGDKISGVGGKGHVEWEFDLLEANTNITINPPDGCSAPAGNDLPKMPDAQEGFSMNGMSSYTTASAAADVVAFYQAQMPAAGWTAGTANTTDALSTLSFTKDGKTATITITTDSGKTTVLIQVQ